MKLLKSIMFGLFLWIMVYFTFAFFQGEYDPHAWGTDAQGLSGFLAFMAFVLGTFIYYQKDDL